MSDFVDTLSVAELTTDDLLSQAVAVKRQLERLKLQYTILCDEMTRRVEAGDLDPGGFSYDDVPFSYSDGKKTHEYPDNVKEIEENLEEAKRKARSDGSATLKIGSPFWTLPVKK